MRAGHAEEAGPTDHLAAVAAAVDVLGALAEPDVPIGPMTTYRVGGAADIFVRLRSRADIDTVAHALSVSRLPVLILGRGSNLLVADAGFRGIAVSAADICGSIEIDEDAAQVVAGGGVLLPVLARRCAAASLTGFEWAVGVPGSVGGAVKMNAGGHGADMSASLRSVTVADFTSAPPGEPVSGRGASVVSRLHSSQLGLRFRGSAITATQLVLDATLQLAPGDREAAEQQLSEIVRWRRANQPGGQNAGSVFVNPVPGEVSAGALIDGAGLRGLRHRAATVSDKHANFIQADDGGSADDVRELMRIVRERVEAVTGYRLRSEIRLIGFEDGA